MNCYRFKTVGFLDDFDTLHICCSPITLQYLLYIISPSNKTIRKKLQIFLCSSCNVSDLKSVIARVCEAIPPGPFTGLVGHYPLHAPCMPPVYSLAILYIYSSYTPLPPSLPPSILFAIFFSLQPFGFFYVFLHYFNCLASLPFLHFIKFYSFNLFPLQFCILFSLVSIPGCSLFFFAFFFISSTLSKLPEK